jgi:hypothetical protein
MGTEIILTGDISGTRNGKEWPPRGTRLELNDEEAAGMLRAGTAIRADDERARHIGNGNGGEVFSDEMLAGAPTARDWTEGQPDTNLSRANFLALHPDDTREVTRAAAERAGLDDAHTVPGRAPGTPVVGDDKPNPTDLPTIVPATVDAEDRSGKSPDDGAKLLDDVETASLADDAETAADTSKPSGRKTTTSK